MSRRCHCVGAKVKWYIWRVGANAGKAQGNDDCNACNHALLSHLTPLECYVTTPCYTHRESFSMVKPLPCHDSVIMPHGNYSFLCSFFVIMSLCHVTTILCHYFVMAKLCHILTALPCHEQPTCSYIWLQPISVCLILRGSNGLNGTCYTASECNARVSITI